MGYREYKWDIFICHATEDKPAIAGPLDNHLRNCELNVWYDEKLINVGDLFFQKIKEGLKDSMLVVAIISPDSANKPFPNWEIGATLLNPDDGRNRLIPLFYNIPEKDKLEIKKYFQLINHIDIENASQIPEAVEKINNQAQITKARIKEEREKKEKDEKYYAEKRRQEIVENIQSEVKGKIWKRIAVMLFVAAIILLFILFVPYKNVLGLSQDNRSMSSLTLVDSIGNSKTYPVSPPLTRSLNTSEMKNEKPKDNNLEMPNKTTDRIDNTGDMPRVNSDHVVTEGIDATKDNGNNNLKVQIKNSETVIKDCETKGTGDFYFSNNTDKKLIVIMDDAGELILNTGRIQCYYNILAASHHYTIKIFHPWNGYQNNDLWDIGNALVEKCKSDTVTLTNK